ncbi:MAG: RidA family protein, partial [Actinomycetia bacterium]|nr:RidA family protein [Actinomycetes bacterium]
MTSTKPGRSGGPASSSPQIAGALENLASALAAESCGLDDVVRLKAFYHSDGQTSEWSVLGALADAFGLLPG